MEEKTVKKVIIGHYTLLNLIYLAIGISIIIQNMSYHTQFWFLVVCITIPTAVYHVPGMEGWV